MRFGPGFSLVESEHERDAELLLQAASPAAREGRAERLEALARGQVDWEWILQVAEHNRVTPLLHRALARHCPAGVPATIRGELEDRVRRNCARNATLVSALLEASALLDGAGLRAIPFKGPVLASSVHGNLDLRQSWDLDLIVDPGQYRAILHLLLDHGFERDDFTEWWACTLRHVRTQVKFDVHRSFGPRDAFRPLAFDTLWAAHGRVTLEGAAIRSLSAEHTLVMLCINIAKDYSTGRLRLSKVCDLAEVLRACPEIDWAAVDAAAPSLSVLSLGLLLARDLLGASLPEDRARIAQDDRAASAAVGHLVRGETLARPVFLGGERVRDRVRHAVLRSVYKARYVARLALTPSARDTAFLPLPARLHALYFVVRPIRLAASLLRSPGRIARNVIDLFR